MDRETWHAAVYGVAKSRIRLSDWTEHLIISLCNLLRPTVQLDVWKNLPRPAIIVQKYIRASEKSSQSAETQSMGVGQTKQVAHTGFSLPLFQPSLLFPSTTLHRTYLKRKNYLETKAIHLHFTYTSTKLIVFWGNTGKETDKEKGKEAYKQNLYQTPNRFK